MPTDQGHGISVTFSGATGFIANLRGVRWGGSELPVVDDTHFGTTGARAFSPGSLPDHGEVELSMLFDPTKTPPVNTGATGTLAITWSDTGSTVWTASKAFCRRFSVDATDDVDRVMATAVFKLSGLVTIV